MSCSVREASSHISAREGIDFRLTFACYPNRFGICGRLAPPSSTTSHPFWRVPLLLTSRFLLSPTILRSFPRVDQLELAYWHRAQAHNLSKELLIGFTESYASARNIHTSQWEMILPFSQRIPWISTEFNPNTSTDIANKIFGNHFP